MAEKIFPTSVHGEPRRKQGRFMEGQDPLLPPTPTRVGKPKREPPAVTNPEAVFAVAPTPIAQMDHSATTHPSMAPSFESDDELMELAASTANQFKKEALA